MMIIAENRKLARPEARRTFKRLGWSYLGLNACNQLT
jgi:hypothetical protein